MNQQEIVQRHMDAVSMTRYALARDTGVKEATIYKFMQGKFQIEDPAILYPIADALEIDRDTLALAGGHVPHDVKQGILNHPQLIPVIRTLLAKLDSQDSRHT